MSVRTFEADSMARALALVKRDLGPQAVILRTRTHRRGGVLGVGSRQVVEITARADELAKSERGTRNVEPRTPSPEPSGIVPRSDLRVPASTPDLSNEVRQIRQMVHRMMRLQVTQPRPDLSDTLFNQYLGLLEQEVAEELADEVIRAAQRRLVGAGQDDPHMVRREVAEQIAGLLPPATETEPRRPADGRPLTLALIGPTGVGKTTTLAKLAADFKLRRSLRVSMVTIDTYRIAAVDQLRTYAQILAVPLHVVVTPLEMGRALDRCAEDDVVLIDTAGRSPRDAERLDDLSRMLHAARPHEVHLVLASNVGQRAMLETVERFRVVGFDRVLFTKLDEAVSFGVLLNVARKVDAKLSYLTTGQEVPHRIEPGEPRRVAGLILGEKV